MTQWEAPGFPARSLAIGLHPSSQFLLGNRRSMHLPGLMFWCTMYPNILALWRRKGLLHRDLAFSSASGSALELNPPVSKINGKTAVVMESSGLGFKF